jgi:hypothetical protein
VSPIKRPQLLALARKTPQPPVVPSAGSRQGGRGEPSFPQPPFQTIVPSTTSRTYGSLSTPLAIQPGRRVAGAELLAADTAWLHRADPTGTASARVRVEIKPMHSLGPPPARSQPTPAVDWPEFGRSRAGRPPRAALRGL